MKRAGNPTVRRARALVGSQFRPQGRDPASGLDCVGVVLCALDIPASDLRRDYRLRGLHRAELEAELTRRLKPVKAGDRRPGDVLLCAAAEDQLHLAIDCGGSFVHADASLRRVVETPGELCWPLERVFRRRRSSASS